MKNRNFIPCTFWWWVILIEGAFSPCIMLDRLCYNSHMGKGTKPPRDINRLAALIAEQATSDSKPNQPVEPQKNPAAVALGRLGGKKGGKARALSLSAGRKREIARNAAFARWNRAREERE